MSCPVGVRSHRVDSRFRGSDGINAGAVIPAEAGIHTSVPPNPENPLIQ